MRALAADTRARAAGAARRARRRWTVGVRTGDTPRAERARQARRLPTALVTTPESLSPDADARADAREELAARATRWSSTSGTSCSATSAACRSQLALARLRRWNPGLRVWGLSATLGNLDEALHVLLGARARPCWCRAGVDKKLVIDTLLPGRPAASPWAGHLGSQMQPPVVEEIERRSTTLVFTNMRSQAEIWYQALLEARPDWAGLIALHHGSLDQRRARVGRARPEGGHLKAVVGDLAPRPRRRLPAGRARAADRLAQGRGAAAAARGPLRPRAGPASRVTLVPTHTLELVEAAAARRAARPAASRRAARRTSRSTCWCSTSSRSRWAAASSPRRCTTRCAARAPIATSRAPRWQWALDFVTRGGAALTAYPDYHARAPDDDGVYRVPDARLARRHRMSIGTIVSDASDAGEVPRAARRSATSRKASSRA